MKNSFITLLLLFTLLVGTAFGQFQVPLFAPGNAAGKATGMDNSMLSVAGLNAVGLTSDNDYNVYLGLLAPVKYVFTNSQSANLGNTRLFQNYPNPYNNNTTIPFEISKLANVKLSLINVMGQQVEVILDREFPPGKHLVPFDARHINPGLYLYRLEVGGFQATKNMVLSH